MDERLRKLLSKLEQKNKENYTFSMMEIDEIAMEILSILGYRFENTSTPIVKIVKQFDFKAYSEYMEDRNLSGDISINGNTMDTYGHNQVIIVNKMDELYHQRFVAAHELGHYLFDFLGNQKYADRTVRFNAAYYKDKHDTADEKRANRFAASILMPKDLFIKQYNVARNTDSNPLFIPVYLSRYFETSVSSIEKRIIDLL